MRCGLEGIGVLCCTTGCPVMPDQRWMELTPIPLLSRSGTARTRPLFNCSNLVIFHTNHTQGWRHIFLLIWRGPSNEFHAWGFCDSANGKKRRYYTHMGEALAPKFLLHIWTIKHNIKCINRVDGIEWLYWWNFVRVHLLKVLCKMLRKAVTSVTVLSDQTWEENENFGFLYSNKKQPGKVMLGLRSNLYWTVSWRQWWQV